MWRKHKNWTLNVRPEDAKLRPNWEEFEQEISELENDNGYFMFEVQFRLLSSELRCRHPFLPFMACMAKRLSLEDFTCFLNKYSREELTTT